MHYLFKSKAAADLLMMAPIGDQLLRIVGREPAAQGIVEATALPAAIAAIEAAIAVEDRSAAAAGNDAEADDTPHGDRVSLRRRAWPMLEMMKRALAERADIVWGV
ncbi:MAG: DUF1840 domain-containing protein [Pseudomonadota bacterium]|nr:DUF1840 domain-containing protein [Pseudomonadota bacterium]